MIKGEEREKERKSTLFFFLSKSNLITVWQLSSFVVAMRDYCDTIFALGSGERERLRIFLVFI